MNQYNPIHNGGNQTSVTSINVGINPQNAPAFSFNSFVTLMQNVKTIPSASPKLSNLNQGHLSKEMLELPVFGYMITFTI